MNNGLIISAVSWLDTAVSGNSSMHMVAHMFLAGYIVRNFNQMEVDVSP